MNNFNKKILLLGGAGYVGTELTKLLLEKSFSITNIDNLIYDNFYSIRDFINNPNYTFLNSNINSENIDKNFLNNFSSVIILSGLVGDPITKKYPILSEEIINNLFEGQENEEFIYYKEDLNFAKLFLR